MGWRSELCAAQVLPQQTENKPPSLPTQHSHVLTGDGFLQTVPTELEAHSSGQGLSGMIQMLSGSEGFSRYSAYTYSGEM